MKKYFGVNENYPAPLERRERKKLVGFSLGGCIKDIIHGRVRAEDVLVIITNTDFDPNNEQAVQEILEAYSGMWEKNPTLAESNLRDLIRDHKIQQPRRENGSPEFKYLDTFRRNKHSLWFDTILQKEHELGGSGIVADEEKENRARRLSRVVRNLHDKILTDPDSSGAEAAKGVLKRLVGHKNKVAGLRQLRMQRPVFFERKTEELSEFVVNDEFSYLLEEPEFQKMIANPTDYIENVLHLIKRGNTSDSELKEISRIFDYAKKPYDVSKVKVFSTKRIKIVVKRVDKSKVSDDLEEERLMQQALVCGIPTPRVVGHIRDKGNTYLLFEHISETLNCYDWLSFIEKQPNVQTEQYFFYPVDLTRSDGVLPYTHSIYHEKGAKIHIGDENLFKNFDIIMDNYSFQVTLRFYIESLLVYPIKLRLSRVKEDQNSDYNKRFCKIILENGLSKDNLLKLLDKTQIEIEQIKLDFYNKWDRFLQKVVLGAEYRKTNDDFIKSTKSRLAEFGIAHKDFALRNILVAFDKKTGKLIPDKNGNAQFYLIDWEQG